MECLQCRHGNLSTANFCEECGARLTLVCVKCGQELRPATKFCPSCGEPSSKRQQGRDASPASYTPRYLAQRILGSRGALEGERKPVTVLFCDVVESTQLAQRLDPEIMYEVMDRALSLMAEAVHRYDGTVNQFLGHGLMALFGAPLDLADD